MISLIEANFTQHIQYLNQEKDIVIRERDKYNHEAIVLRRDKTMIQEQLAAYTRYFTNLSACLSINLTAWVNNWKLYGREEFMLLSRPCASI